MQIATPVAAAADSAPRAQFEPVGETPLYPPPPARVDPDPKKPWIRRLLPIVLARPLWLGSAVLASVLNMLTTVAAPAILGLAINDALARGPLADSAVRSALRALCELSALPLGEGGRIALQSYVALMAALGLLRIAVAGYYRYGLARVAYHIETDLRALIYDHLIRLPFSFYDRVQSGQIISRANSDIRAIQMLLAFAPMMIVSWLSFGVALCFMLSVHVGLTLAAALALPGIILIGRQMRKELFPLSWMAQSRSAEVATIIDESIQGVRVVKSFAAERRQVQTLAQAAQRLQWASSELVRNRARYAPLMENVARLGPAFVLLYGGYLVLQGRIEGVGTLVTFNTYMILLQAPFRVLGFFMSMNQRAEASAARIFEILDEPLSIADRSDAVDLPRPQGRIELRDVDFRYPGTERKVLDGLSLAIEPGQTVALVGRTGCGKSTVARLLARFYDCDAGSVRIDDHDVRAVTLTSLRAHIGLVLDEPFLFSLSVRDNIAYGRPDASLAEVQAAAKAACAHDFITELEAGYDTLVGERGYTLSGGQRQRIVLARLFLTNPPIVVLDDATSAIDVRVEAEILDALARLLRARTTLLISHRESSLRLADRVLWMEAGKVVAHGTHDQLLAREPGYAAVLARAQAERTAGSTPARAGSARNGAKRSLPDLPGPDRDKGSPFGGPEGGLGL